MKTESSDLYTCWRVDRIDDQLIEAIAQNPGALNNDIATAVGIPKERARYRLMTLELQGIIHSVRERKFRHYFLNPSARGNG